MDVFGSLLEDTRLAPTSKGPLHLIADTHSLGPCLDSALLAAFRESLPGRIHVGAQVLAVHVVRGHRQHAHTWQRPERVLLLLADPRGSDADVVGEVAGKIARRVGSSMGCTKLFLATPSSVPFRAPPHRLAVLWLPPFGSWPEVRQRMSRGVCLAKAARVKPAMVRGLEPLSEIIQV